MRRLESPVFLVGCGRSGTTLLAGLLDAHPGTCVFPSEANHLWHPHAYPWRSSRLELPPIWVDPETFTRLSVASRTAADDRRIQGSFGAYQYLAGNARFINKSVMLVFMIAEVLELFPDARFVHVVRDGRDVAFSYARKQTAKIRRYRAAYESRGFAYSFAELLDRLALFWSRQIAEIERLRGTGILPSELLYQLRYEDLCARPGPELEGLALFLALEPGGFDRDRFPEIRSVSSRYRSQLEPELVARLERSTAAARRLAGYEA